VDPADPFPDVPFAQRHGRHPCAPNIGVCMVWIVLPLPRYMCTPHGRHGSKLRTVRMMSIPLKLSRPFSSKIFSPVTASSYGPGVPKLSFGLAFHGVGGYGW